MDRSTKTPCEVARCCVAVLAFMLCAYQVNAQNDGSDVLKALSIEELMGIEVTSVSRLPEKLTEVPSAVQVITREDILRAGVTNLPDALRLVTNLQVAQLNSYGWVISARGFNNVFSNKLLVMIDGRTVYTPLFAGVYWDAQSVLLEDIERIEVISGPGGTLWGANAVNGVINIITRHSKESTGVYAEAGYGTHMRTFGAIRYGARLGENLTMRVFLQHQERMRTILPDDTDNADRWKIAQAGWRLDWNPDESNELSVQSNYYNGTEYVLPSKSTFDGQNILGKWRHAFSNGSDVTVQMYYDRTWRRDIPSTISDELDTYDLDVHHHFTAGERHNFVWGGGYRMMIDKSQHGTIFLGFLPEKRNMPLYSLFVQDEISVAEKWKLTLGTKLQHNVFTGFEVQPNARLTWQPEARNTIWAAVSRAVRAPSRIDADYYIPTYEVPPPGQSVAGGPNFGSETVVAYEAGWRMHTESNLTLSLAAFYNVYDDLYSVEALPGTLTFQIMNGMEGTSHGGELALTYRPLDSWKLRAGYTYFDKVIREKPGHTFDVTYAGTDAPHQLMIQSVLDLPGNFQFDILARYMDTLPSSVTAGTPEIPSYFTMNVRAAWKYNNLELAVVGQNVLKETHLEYNVLRVPRNIFGRVAVRF